MIIKILRALQNKEDIELKNINGQYVLVTKTEKIISGKKDIYLFNKALHVVINALQFDVEDELSNGPHYD